jgi:predicted HicB family RNase H-like nuclease
MPKKTRHQGASTIFYLKGTSREVARKLKAAAALEGKSLTAYVQELLEGHVEELERKGLLPKGK